MPDALLNGVRAPVRLLMPSADRNQLLFAAGMRFSPEQPVGALDGEGAVHVAGLDGGVQWISKPSWAGVSLPPGAPGVQSTKFTPVGGSEDFSTVYFMTRQVLTPQDGASGRAWDAGWALYKVKDGVLSNAGSLPDGTVDASGSMSAGLDLPAALAGNNNVANLTTTLSGHVVSRNGARALFTDTGARVVPGRVGQLLMHRDGQPSSYLSKKPSASTPIPGSTGVVPLGIFDSDSGSTVNATGAASMAAGDRDLKVAVFATRDGLTDDAPSDGTRVNTYRLDVDSNQLEYLAEFDRPAAPIAADNRRRLGNVYRVSDDASRILFRTPTGEVKLWRDGQPTLTLATGVAVAGFSANGITGARFSDDGKTVVFMSRQAIGGEPTHPAGNSPLQTEVYRFEEGVDAAPRCVSCPPVDAAVRGPAAFDLATPLNSGFAQMFGSNLTATQSRGISADGSRVFFTTSSTLDARDENASADVYEWSAERGTAALISSGDPDSRGDSLIDIDAAGDNVFFASEIQLTASDTDELFDLYVARVGGGLPDPPGFDTETGCVLPNKCQGPVLPSPPLQGSGSGGAGPVTEGPKDVDQPASPPKLAVPRTRTSSTRVTVGVRVPGAGTIRVSGRGIRSVSRNTTRSTTYTVHARLSKTTKRRIARRGKTRVTLRVRFTPRSGATQSKTVKVTVKRASKTSRRGR